jgi:hypothetical protein
LFRTQLASATKMQNFVPEIADKNVSIPGVFMTMIYRSGDMYIKYKFDLTRKNKNIP